MMNIEIVQKEVQRISDLQAELRKEMEPMLVVANRLVGRVEVILNKTLEGLCPYVAFGGAEALDYTARLPDANSTATEILGYENGKVQVHYFSPSDNDLYQVDLEPGVFVEDTMDECIKYVVAEVLLSYVERETNTTTDKVSTETKRRTELEKDAGAVTNERARQRIEYDLRECTENIEFAKKKLEGLAKLRQNIEGL